MPPEQAGEPAFDLVALQQELQLVHEALSALPFWGTPYLVSLIDAGAGQLQFHVNVDETLGMDLQEHPDLPAGVPLRDAAAAVLQRQDVDLWLRNACTTYLVGHSLARRGYEACIRSMQAAGPEHSVVLLGPQPGTDLPFSVFFKIDA